MYKYTLTGKWNTLYMYNVHVVGPAVIWNYSVAQYNFCVHVHVKGEERKSEGNKKQHIQCICTRKSERYTYSACVPILYMEKYREAYMYRELIPIGSEIPDRKAHRKAFTLLPVA